MLLFIIQQYQRQQLQIDSFFPHKVQVYHPQQPKEEVAFMYVVTSRRSRANENNDSTLQKKHYLEQLENERTDIRERRDT